MNTNSDYLYIYGDYIQYSPYIMRWMS